MGKNRSVKGNIKRFLVKGRSSWRENRKALLWGSSIYVILFVLWLFSLPRPLFDDPYATVVKSREGHLLGARIADDGQWRFPALDSLPERYKTCVLLFEDEYFYKHDGFNPFSIGKAFWHNLTQDSRRGGSTITQQLVRLSRKNKSRTYTEKLRELWLATRVELSYDKDEILRLYASHTPYGGNVVGLETASWRYFGMAPEQLSWGQSATLAVLPNAPSLIFPGRNADRLKDKRDRLLRKLGQRGVLDSLSLQLALEEPLPGKPLALPQWAPHFTEWIRSQHSGKPFRSTLQADLQRRVVELVKMHHGQLKQNEIHNMAALVMDIETREVLAYVGNAPGGKEHGEDVDIVRRERSTGSLLKPLLFASAMNEGELLPNTLIADIPTLINGYNPQNFDKQYRGAVSASLALARSLNVPAVRTMRSYGLEKFYNRLEEAKIPLNKGPGHYGLSLVLGGAESSLWELTQCYASMASRVNYYSAHSSTYRPNEFGQVIYEDGKEIKWEEESLRPEGWSAGGIYLALEAMQQVNRPDGDENWEFFDDSQRLAWKTGTSYGFKDAWAIGVSSRYAIGVWAGNADGEGRPGLTGIKAAAPLLFDILELLPRSNWFAAPLDDLARAEICLQSGYLAGPHCDHTESQWITPKGLNSPECRYHKPLFLDQSGRYQANADCYPLADLQTANWFSLPPLMEYYYRKFHPEYRVTPPFLAACEGGQKAAMEFIYPYPKEEILLPVDFDEQVGEVIFTLAHRNAESEVHWYLDDRYLSSTRNIHELAVSPKPGDYVLTVVDQDGRRLEQKITIKKARE